jgi:hypothetical protein
MRAPFAMTRTDDYGQRAFGVEVPRHLNLDVKHLVAAIPVTDGQPQPART